MLLPRTCPLCHRPGPAPCVECASALDAAPNLPPPSGVDICRAVLVYDGLGRELVARLKYRNARTTLRWLATQMVLLVGPSDVDLVTWIPTTAARRRERGFDQAQLLALGVARGLHRPCRPLLARAHGPPQTGRTGVERLVGPALSVRPSARRHPPPRRVVLVDDVITTGSTFSVAARALRAAGVERIVAVAAARTPLKRIRTSPEARVR
ncbi:MAG TPA: phosphoribosyltransferase family protein [Acidimicrobiales bacterium]|nr:phosphoribosyltransferase family protein [Acidimicrobiales bacterium]